MNREKRGLGRGLSALMADVNIQDGAEPGGPPRTDIHVPIEQIAANPHQPRRNFTEQNLRELSESIQEKGVLQPLIVRRRESGEARFEIVAGERRWRAAQMAQLHELPVIVRDFSDVEVLEVAIIENIQRADLNPVEEAAGFRQLMDKFGHTQEKLAAALGKSRSHIANLLRLLQLPDDVQTLLADGKLSAGHARALITSDDPGRLAQIVVKKGLSVRETENLVRKPTQASSKESGRVSPKAAEKDADTRVLEQDLSANIGMKVSIDHSSRKDGGVVSITYQSLDNLDELCRLLSAGERGGTI